MLSKSKIKLIRSLERKRTRSELGLFVAEGDKLVSDMMGEMECTLLVATATWLQSCDNIVADEVIEASREEIDKASLMQSPQSALGVFKIPQSQLNISKIEEQLVIALDGVQDPGNLGTIVRIADWYGIDTILASPDCADIYNPKTVQATMGALTRVKVSYVNLVDTIKHLNTQVYGTFLDGESIYETDIPPCGVIVMGNEGKGISPEVERVVTNRVFLPPFPADNSCVESLNVGVATAITCAEFRRRFR